MLTDHGRKLALFLSLVLIIAGLLTLVPVVIADYSLFAISAMASAAIIYFLLKGKRDALALARLNRIDMISVYMGLILLVADTIMGAIWANAALG